MIDLNYLFFFSSETMDVFEIKRLDLGPNSSLSQIYKWLVYSKESKTIWELDFKSMEEVNSYQFRNFIEGSLKFNEHEAELQLLGKEFKLMNVSKVEVAASFNAMVSDYLTHKAESNPLFGLRHLKPSDVFFFKNWIVDPEVIKYSLTKFHTLKTTAQICDWYFSTLSDPKVWQWGITDSLTQELIGYAGISGINKIDNNGEYFILIGNKSFWRRKIATHVTPKIVEMAFKELGLHRIFLTASSDNPGAVKAYEKAGFIHEGIMREAFFRDGKFSDKIIMGVLKE